jgi:flagellar hook-associated protein 1 FlgK
MNVDLFTIATSGVSASNQLLNTTGRNIANVNTEGYVRQETSFVGSQFGGVGRATTERVLNNFAQNQLRRDNTTVGELSAFNQNTAALDRILANESNSVANGMSQLFSAIQTAADDPTSLPSRDLVLGQMESLLGRIKGLGDYMQSIEREMTLAFSNEVTKANSLIQTIADLNEQISVVSGNGGVGDPNILMDERDQAINELSGIMGIQVRQNSSNPNTVSVSLASGEALVMENGRFNMLQMGSDPDSTFQVLELTTNFSQSGAAKFDTSINVTEGNLGGTLGGLFRFRNEVLSPSMRELGQTTIALADQLNLQNRLGMDLDGQLGQDLFVIPDFKGLNYQGNQDLTSQANGRIIPGQSREITDSDYQVTLLSAPSGTVPPTFDIEVAALNPDGSQTLDQNNQPITQTYTVTAESGTFNAVMGGIEIEFASGSNYAQGDQFLFQPTRRASVDIELASQRPEDLALAGPMRVSPDPNNYGDAIVTDYHVTNTSRVSDATRSAFNADGSLHTVADSPHPTLGAPAQIVFTASDTYQVLDSEDNLISTVNGAAQLDNLLARAQDAGVPAWPAEFGSLNDYPGYDLSLQGNPEAGDRFTLGFNHNGFADNANALEMAGIQERGVLRVSNNDTDNFATLHENYANLVGRVGEEAGRSEISLEAAIVMQEQSQDFFDSVSGVNLDEEAANLIRFQQAYAASARIISTAQSLFETILNSMR